MRGMESTCIQGPGALVCGGGWDHGSFRTLTGMFCAVLVRGTGLLPFPQDIFLYRFPARSPSVAQLMLQKGSSRLPGLCPFSQGVRSGVAFRVSTLHIETRGCWEAQRPSQE